MSVLMEMHWPEITVDIYEGFRKTVNWEGDVPKGAIFHTAAFDNGIHVVDIWESAEDFNSFVENRLMPAVQKAGLKTQPQPNIYPIYAIFNPGVDQQ